MNRIDFTALVYSVVGQTYKRDGRDVHVISFINGKISREYLCVWKDTSMAFTAPITEVLDAFGIQYPTE